MTALAIDTGNTAWLLAASALVLLMAPGLALFYGGMVRSKSVLNMMMMTFGSLARHRASSGSWSATRSPSATTSASGLVGDPDAVRSASAS